MMNDGKIHIPGRKREKTGNWQQPIIRLTNEAYDALVEIYNESTISMTKIASEIIMQSLDRIVYDREG